MNEQPLRDVIISPQCEADIAFFAAIDTDFDDLYREAIEWAFARSPMEGDVAVEAVLPNDGRHIRAIAHITRENAIVRAIEFKEL
jgi:hypothetical protein